MTNKNSVNQLHWLFLGFILCLEPSYAQDDTTQLLRKNIEQHLKHQQWTELKHLLFEYQNTKSADPILILYTQGALARHYKNYTYALDAYRKILAIDPSLIYVRFDLALMLIENKQSIEAEQQLRQLNSAQLDNNFRQIIKNLINTIHKDQKWRLSTQLQYIYNNNINNASDIQKFQGFCSSRMDCVELQKSDEYLPIVDHGLNYSTLLEKNKNISGQHYISSSFNTYGTSYVQEKKFNEVSAQFMTGYRHQSVQSDLSILPFYQYTWLEHDSYLDMMGISLQYKYWLNLKWLAAIQQSYSKKHYAAENIAAVYDGINHRSQLQMTYLYSPSFILFAGLDHQQDDLTDKSESSYKLKNSLGIYKEFPYGLNSKLNLSYAYRSFDQISLMGQVVGLDRPRRDREYQIDLSLWHRNIQYYGIFPKININHHKVESNLEMFYSRKNTQFFISLEKQLW